MYSLSEITKWISRHRESQKKYLCLVQAKWVERQNQHIEKSFTEIVRKIESLYRNDAAKQVANAQQNILADFGELFTLRNDVKSLTENNDNLKSTLETMP